jgi:hypothetical protein
MANVTAKETDYARYKLLRHSIPYLSPAAGDIQPDIEERAALEAKHPEFPARYAEEMKQTTKPALPVVGLGRKRKRSRKGKTKHRRHATQSHRRVKA